MQGERREEYSADIVVVSCGAANTAALLLASAGDKHPRGLANGSDQVGRNYMFHNSQAVLALSEEPNPTVFQKTLGLNDFYFGTDGFDFPMGNIQMVGKSTAEMYRGEKPLETALAPERTLRNIAEHAVDFWLSTEDLPSADNRVTLDDKGRIHLAYTPANEAARDRLYHQLKSMLGDLGMHPHHLVPRHAYLKTAIPVAGVAHQAGTCRFGDDPDSSALDPNCRAHELDNLYVVDTSCLPEHQRGQPGADGDGKRPARGRPPAGADGRGRGRAGRGRLIGQRRPVRSRYERADRQGATAWRAPPPPHPGPDDRDPPGGRERNPRHPAAAVARRPQGARRGMGGGAGKRAGGRRRPRHAHLRRGSSGGCGRRGAGIAWSRAGRGAGVRRAAPRTRGQRRGRAARDAAHRRRGAGKRRPRGRHRLRARA